MTTSKHTGTGLACGIAAGACWGFVFLAPELAAGYSPLQLAVGRYLAYGLFSVALIAPQWRTLRAQLHWRDWRTLLWLSAVGNVIYYVLLAQAVRSGGVAMASLVIGFLPVAVTLVGSRGAGAVPLRRLMPSLLLGGAGIFCIAWQSLQAASDGAGAGGLFGLLCATGALIAWTTYAVGNSRALLRLNRISSHQWSLLTGLITGGMAVLLAIPAFLWSSDSHSSTAWLHFAGIAAGVALVASIIGNAFWNRASRLLPLTMIGQMILFETLFALLYGLLWEARWPTLLESISLMLVAASVLSCVAVHRTPVPQPAT